MMRKMGLRDMLKEPFKKPTPLEMIAAELSEAAVIAVTATVTLLSFLIWGK